MQGLIGVTLSAGVPTLHEGLHGISSHSFFLGALYIVALGTGGTALGVPARTCRLFQGLGFSILGLFRAGWHAFPADEASLPPPLLTFVMGVSVRRHQALRELLRCR